MKLIAAENNAKPKQIPASELYELGSVQLRKRLFPQAELTLKKALKRLIDEPEEAKAVIENALGFSIAAQGKYEAASKHYELAIKAKKNYPIAINNLAFAKEKLSQFEEAIKLYDLALKVDPTNKTAKKRKSKLEKF